MAYFRFQRRIRLPLGMRLNLSKSGVGISTGIPGLRAGVGPNGVRLTAGLPGTGMSIVHQRSIGRQYLNGCVITPGMVNFVANHPAATRRIINTHAAIERIASIMAVVSLIGLGLFLLTCAGLVVGCLTGVIQ